MGLGFRGLGFRVSVFFWGGIWGLNLRVWRELRVQASRFFGVYIGFLGV